MDERTARAAVAATAQMMESASLAESFGHVSARWGDGFLITSTRPFSVADADDVVRVDHSAAPPSGGRNVPLETPMHAVLYLTRSDIGAVCRGHPPAVVAWGTGTGDLPLLHGLGALAGVTVPVHPDVDLITTPRQAAALAATLGSGSSLILRANGCLAVGAGPLEALTRLYYLEERARVALQRPPSEGGGDRLGGPDPSHRTGTRPSDGLGRDDLRRHLEAVQAARPHET